MNRLVITKGIWKTAQTHLLQDNNEHFAFFLAGIARSERGISFLAKEIILVQDSDLVVAKDKGLELKLEALLRVTAMAKSKGLALVEAHSHPWTKRNVRFSPIDMNGLKEFVPYILKDLPGLPYAATVWGTNSVDGLYWKSATEQPLPLNEVRIVGESLTRMTTTSAMKQIRTKQQVFTNTTDDARVSRQVLAFGKEGQRRIKKTKVGIVGAGGMGCHVAQQLAYLGVRDFVIVDFDMVDITNLNRLVGASILDIRKSKVKVIKRMIHFITGKENTKVKALKAGVRSLKVLEALKQVDFIFGCVDNDGARLILNEFALAYMIPYIDCAVGINTEKGVITEAGGRVIIILPDSPCLLCANEIDIRAASNELAPTEELEERRRLGYVAGADVPSPAVVSLNGIIASAAVTEFLALVSDFRSVHVYTYYDMLEQRMGKRLVKPNPKCVACSVRGLGDLAHVERYSNTEVPKDIPKL